MWVCGDGVGGSLPDPVVELMAVIAFRMEKVMGVEGVRGRRANGNGMSTTPRGASVPGYLKDTYTYTYTYTYTNTYTYTYTCTCTYTYAYTYTCIHKYA